MGLYLKINNQNFSLENSNSQLPSLSHFPLHFSQESASWTNSRCRSGWRWERGGGIRSGAAAEDEEDEGKGEDMYPSLMTHLLSASLDPTRSATKFKVSLIVSLVCLGNLERVSCRVGYFF